MTIVLELLFLTFLIGSDLISKAVLKPFLTSLPNDTYVVLDKIFEFHYVENAGASFSSFEGQTGFLIAITSIVLVLLIALLIWQKDMPKFARYSVLMIIGGGIGNLYDRIALGGKVRDFIDYKFLETFFGIDFAIGNIADIYLCIGVLMVIVYVIFAFDEKDYSLKWRKNVEKRYE